MPVIQHSTSNKTYQAPYDNVSDSEQNETIYILLYFIAFFRQQYGEYGNENIGYAIIPCNKIFYKNLGYYNVNGYY